MAIPFMNDEVNSNDTILLSSETIKLIERSLTENAYMILEKLYNMPGIRQKDLSATLHCSPSNLSNQLSRIYAVSPPLIESEQRGRDKFFFLTPQGKAYVCQEMKRRAEQFTPNYTSSNSIQFNDVNFPKHVINNALSNSLKDYTNISPLLNFEQSEYSIMFRIIDKTFSDLYPSIFSSIRLEKEIIVEYLTDAQYYALYYSLSQIVHHCRKNKLDKQSIIEYMRSILYLEETPPALFYIAEKIDRILATENAGVFF